MTDTATIGKLQALKRSLLAYYPHYVAKAQAIGRADHREVLLALLTTYDHTVVAVAYAGLAKRLAHERRVSVDDNLRELHLTFLYVRVVRHYVAIDGSM